MVERDDEEKVEVDALCPDCGRGFKVYVQRILPEEHSGHGRQMQDDVSCPHCGCHECKIQSSL